MSMTQDEINADLFDEVKKLRATNQHLENALNRIIDLYIANEGTENEFISCITPKSASEMTFKERRSNKTWRVFDDARELLNR